MNINYKLPKLFFLVVLIIGSFLFVADTVSAQTSSCFGSGIGPFTWTADFSYGYQACKEATRFCYNGETCTPNQGTEMWSVNTKMGPQGEEPSLGDSILCGIRPDCVAPAVNGDCAALHNNCNAGTLGSATEYGDSYQWWCNGTNGGTNELCTEWKPINGVCAIPEIHNNCASGVLGSATEYSDSYQWWCNGRNGGTNELCTEMKGLPAENGSCAIPEIHNNCASGVLGSATEYSNSYQWWCNGLRGGTNELCTEFKPVIVNGSCAGTHNNCAAGTSQDTADTSTLYKWNCNGSGGGTNASCTETIPPGMSGSISASSCTIDAGSGQCDSSLSWSTSNPEGTSSVTTPTGVTIASTLSGTASYPVVYGSRNFYLYNNGSQLAFDTATATCVAGTNWNGSVCQVTSVTEPDLTASAPTPALATVNVARTFSADISNIGGTSTVISFSNFFQVASAASGGGTITNLASASTGALGAGTSRSITSPLYTFTTTGTKSVRVCADKTNPSSGGSVAEADENNNCSPWTNVTVGTTVGTVSGYHDAYSGTVPASQCHADGWAAYSSDPALDLNVRILSDGVQVATGVAGTYRGDLESAGVCTGGTCSYWINLSGLISSGVNHTITAQAQNPGDGTWNTLTASPKVINCGAPTTGTLTANNCKIPLGASQCGATLNWSTTNPVGTSNITSNTPSANTLITIGNSGMIVASVPYNSRTFFLNNNSAPLASVTPTATCVSGTGWDGAKCVSSAIPVCGNGLVEGSEACDLGVGNNGACPATCSASCTTNVCGGGAVNGACSNPDSHLSPCLTGTPSAITNGISSWTWSCAGSMGGTNASCEELKKKPVIIED